MKEPARIDRNERMLAECYPSFARELRKALEDLRGSGFRPRIQCAWRSPADQRAAYEAGNSKLLYGFHNVTGKNGKPESFAADVLDDDNPLDPSRSYLIMLARVCVDYRLSTGIGWGLPSRVKMSLEVAVTAADLSYSGKVGWDPTHVEPTWIGLADLKVGRRV